MVFKATSSLFYANSQAFIDVIKTSFDNNKNNNVIKSISNDKHGGSKDREAAVVIKKDTNNNNNNNQNKNNNDLININYNNNKLKNSNINSENLSNDEVNNNMSLSLLDEVVAAHTDINQSESNKIHHVIIDMSQVAFVDVVAISALQAVSIYYYYYSVFFQVFIDLLIIPAFFL